MGAHAAPARHRRAARRFRDRTEDRHTLRWALPTTLGFLYGLYAGFLDRGEGPTNWGNVVFGLVSGVVFGLLSYGIGRTQRAMPRELRGLAYGALTGIGVGFLHSVSGATVLGSSVIGLLVGASMFCAAFYFFYTRE
ncbi:hypothetical protein [Streptomyces sp. TRM49041]|uniref:hypothetical protein n=1 Tax=Streptomyces sp. TRM49041 TaxID=2603216 RepID=UPI0011ED7C20|nr:hypothetical protein [Streptomyces sp. TRM49041]